MDHSGIQENRFGYRRSVLEVDIEDLIKRTDLEEETVREVVRILKSEFED